MKVYVDLRSFSIPVRLRVYRYLKALGYGRERPLIDPEIFAGTNEYFRSPHRESLCGGRSIEVAFRSTLYDHVPLDLNYLRGKRE